MPCKIFFALVLSSPLLDLLQWYILFQDQRRLGALIVANKDNVYAAAKERLQGNKAEPSETDLYACIRQELRTLWVHSWCSDISIQQMSLVTLVILFAVNASPFMYLTLVSAELCLLDGLGAVAQVARIKLGCLQFCMTHSRYVQLLDQNKNPTILPWINFTFKHLTFVDC